MPSTSQAHVKPVAAAIGVEAAASKLCRAALDDVALPAIEHDHALLFPSWAVLRKETRPVVGICVDDDHGALAPEADRMTRTQRANRACRLRDDDMIVAMQIDVKPIGAGGCG